jgi:osmotically-inducible protein OsmY
MIKMKSNEELEQKIKDQWLWDPRIEESNINVKVNEDSVIISGSVPSHPQKIYAEADAKEVGNIPTVINDIAVEFSPEFKTPSDKKIKEGLEKIFQVNSCLDASNISISVKEGIVNLKGSVKTYWEKEMVTELASEIPGIISIENKLTVKPVEPLSDKEIKKEIEAALERAIRVNKDKIKIEVKNGVVSLTGTVSSMTAYSAAQRAAKLSKGVIEVRNNLDYVLRYDTS